MTVCMLLLFISRLVVSFTHFTRDICLTKCADGDDGGLLSSPGARLGSGAVPYSFGERVADPQIHYDQKNVPRPRMRGMLATRHAHTIITPLAITDAKRILYWRLPVLGYANHPTDYH